MASDTVKAPVPSDFLKSEPPDFKGREAAKFTSAAALRPGSAPMGGPAAAEVWDPDGAEESYGILLAEVPAGAAAYEAPVPFNGPATVSPAGLTWDSGATAAEIAAGLERLKSARHTREDAADDRALPPTAQPGAGQTD
jgi:hypothetical protein